MARENKKIQAVADWPGILNKSQDIIKAHVNDEGNGVFSLISIFEGTEFQRQSPTISRYLQDLGILIRGRRTAEGAFNWTLSPRKVSVADVRKARSTRTHSGGKTKAKKPTGSARKPRSAKVTTVPTPDSSSIKMSPKESKKVSLAESLPMLVEIVEILRKENAELKAKIIELESHSLSDEIADRVSMLISELTAPPKN